MKSKEQMIEYLNFHREVAVEQKEELEDRIREFTAYANQLGIVIVEDPIYLHFESLFKDVCREINAIDNQLASIEDGTLTF